MSPRQRKRGGRWPDAEIPEGALWGGSRDVVVATDSRQSLTLAQQDEMARARSGQRQWVGPAVAAYMLGISQDTLRKRRQRKVAGKVPAWEPAKSNRQGVRDVWSSVERCANPAHDDVLEKQTRDIEALKRQLHDQQELLRRLLERNGQGLQALATDHAWAVDDDQRVVGLAVCNPGMSWRPMSWHEALLAAWDAEASRQPYHDAAAGLLERVRLACVASNADL